MDKNDAKKETDGNNNKKNIPKNAADDYICGHSCRVCPFPGAKCCTDNKPSK